MHKKSMKIWLSGLFFLAYFAAVTTAYQLFSVDCSVRYEKPAWVEIPSGASTPHIASILHENGILKYPHLFSVTAFATGMDKKIRAGRFRFTAPISTWQLLKEITKGGSFDFLITIPEGFTIFKIAGLMENELGIDSLEFLATCRDTSLMRKLGIPAPNAEGFLFPETYSFPCNIGADSIISLMSAEFKRRWQQGSTARSESLEMTILEIITLASIIEAEAHIKQEQPIISSVYHNRLRIGMMLQADPTTIYALRKFDQQLTLADLEYESPYNTYKRLGLPPGPICNPGVFAIESALYPDSTNYLYFVSRRDGTHIFSTTLEDHHKAVQQVKQSLAKAKKQTNS